MRHAIHTTTFIGLVVVVVVVLLCLCRPAGAFLSSGRISANGRVSSPGRTKIHATASLPVNGHGEGNAYTRGLESAEDSYTRELFERRPFRAAEMTTDAILSQSEDAPLRRVDSDGAISRSDDDDYDRMYAPLFGVESTTTTMKEERPPKKKNEPAYFTKRQSFKVRVAYRGRDFCGWQIQPDHSKPSVQGSLAHILGPILRRSVSPENGESDATSAPTSIADDGPPAMAIVSKRKARRDRKRRANVSKPLNVRVCGRTDAGVSAIGQVCRVRTFRTEEEVSAQDVRDAINDSALGQDRALRCTDVESVDDSFHPTFGCSCRAYSYLIDLQSEQNDHDACQQLSGRHVPLIDAVLRTLEGEELDYFAFSYGKVKTSTTLCTLHRARASVVEINSGTMTNPDQQRQKTALCISFVGNRFLRRMVRILVATAVRESLRILNECPDYNSEDEAVVSTGARGVLQRICKEGRREGSAKAAPPGGLIFVGASFDSAEDSNTHHKHQKNNVPEAVLTQ